jgi:hypothetical protein
MYSEDVFLNPSKTNLLNFDYFSNESSFDTLDDNYENIKNTKLLYFKLNKNIILPSLNYFTPVSFSQVLDSFRPDFDENN